MVSLIMQRRRSLIAPKSTPKSDKLLKSCTRCRLNKTKCDGALRSPLPCTFCTKKNFDCAFEVVKPINRSAEEPEKIVAQVRELHRTVDAYISKKSRLVANLMRARRAEVRRSSSTAIVDQVKSVLDSPAYSKIEAESIYIDPIPTLSLENAFTIHSDQSSKAVTISHDRAQHLFRTFEANYAKHLPVLPSTFFKQPLHTIHQETDLLFWSIIVTSLLDEGTPDEYTQLAAHVQNLVVVNCWFNTPRSLFSVVALLILTTWPLPDARSLLMQDNIAVKYISLMKSLSLQFGLHKLNFIEEFSKKTKLNLDGKSDMSNTIRERIYKYVNINSNYWLVYLGLSTSSYNGFQQDYIVNKAANLDIFQKDEFAEVDNFTNSLLKVSLVQSKMNEAMNDIIEKPSGVAKLIHLNMFEQILKGYSNGDSPLLKNELISLSLEFSKLQLYVYYLSKCDLSLPEYRGIIYRTISCCRSILDLFEAQFASVKNILSIPIHYRFGIELSSLILLKIHSSPLLCSVKHYEGVRQQFLRAYAILTNHGNPEWNHLSKKIITIIHKFDGSDKLKVLALKSRNGTFFLIDKMSNFLVSSLHYELVWHIYESERKEYPTKEQDVQWDAFGLDTKIAQHNEIINYVSTSRSIFS